MIHVVTKSSSFSNMFLINILSTIVVLEKLPLIYLRIFADLTADLLFCMNLIKVKYRNFIYFFYEFKIGEIVPCAKV